MIEAKAVDRIVFPPFQLDLAAGRLACGSEPIELAPKAFGVLQFLAERPGQLVSKEQLLDAIWPDVHVGDNVLKVTISEIRKALADSSRESRIIETAHRRGYRFIAHTEAPRPSPTPANGADVPTTHYARSNDVNIAYQVIGEGSVDLVFVMGWVSHLDYFWTEPSFARFLRRLASFSRLILFDKRGTGLSDRVRVDALPTLEQRMDDVRAVMDAVGSKRAVICGVSEGGAMSGLFAATYPERTAGLVMVGAYAKRIRDDSYPWGPTQAEREEFLQHIQEQWGGPVGIEERAPSMASDPNFRQWWAAYLRTAASPAAAVALTRMNSEADIRGVLPAIRIPTLVLHRSGDRCLRVEEGRYVASLIPGARFVELPGIDHLPFGGDQDSIVDEIEEFVTGTRHTYQSDPVLATVMAAHLRQPSPNKSPSHARQRLQDHITRELAWFRGCEMNPGGDYLVASFDGPARAIRCACAIAYHASRLGIGFTAGLHVGECVISRDGVHGPTVEMARKIESRAEPDEILASATVRDLVAGSGLAFHRKGALPIDETSGALPLLSVEHGYCAAREGPKLTAK